MGEFFIMFIILIAIIVFMMMGTAEAEQLSPVRPKKDLHVTFADVRQERTFSKKTGKIKSDKIYKT